MRRDLPPMTVRQMLERSARAVGRIDRGGLRGATMLSTEDAVAMALTLVVLGLVPIAPGATTPENLIVQKET